MTDFLQLAIQGVALGAIYALIALGFVIVYKATQVINFAQGELVLLGAYLVYAFNQTALPFAASVALAVVVMAGGGWGGGRGEPPPAGGEAGLPGGVVNTGGAGGLPPDGGAGGGGGGGPPRRGPRRRRGGGG